MEEDFIDQELPLAVGVACVDDAGGPGEELHQGVDELATRDAVLPVNRNDRQRVERPVLQLQRVVLGWRRLENVPAHQATTSPVAHAMWFCKRRCWPGIAAAIA